jgi:hypothetical protein
MPLGHDCEYVRQRNSLIKEAERIAIGQCGNGDPYRWTKVFVQRWRNWQSVAYRVKRYRRDTGVQNPVGVSEGLLRFVVKQSPCCVAVGHYPLIRDS